MKKIKIAVVLLGLLMGGASADAQSFLKKAKEKMEQAKQQVEKVSKEVNKAGKGSSNGNTQSSGASSNSNSSASAATSGDDGEKAKELHPDLKHGKVLRDVKKSLKTTPSTITLEATTQHYGLSDFHDGMALVSLNGGIPYFINKKGEKLNLDFELDYLEHLVDERMIPKFENGKVLLKKGNDAVIIDKTGKILKTFTGNIVSLFGFEDGVGFIQYKDGLKMIVEWIDSNGNKIYPDLLNASGSSLGFLHNAPRVLSEGMRAYSGSKEGDYQELWGFVDSNGKWIVNPQYYHVRDFHDGLAAVQTYAQSEDMRKWGFIDKTGKLVIDCKFSKEPSDFDSGYAIVENRAGNAVVIDKSGNSVMTVEERWELSPFLNGYAVLKGYEVDEHGVPVHISYAVTDGGKRKVAYQTDGHFESIEFDRKAGKAYYHFDHGYGLLDLPNMSSKAEGLRGIFSDGVARVDDGYVNENGEYLIKIALSEF